MLTNAAIFTDLAGYFGVQEIDHLTPDQPQQICTAINAAMQTIWAEGPYWMRQGRDAGGLYGPQTITGLSLTKGSKTVGGGVITSDMIGQQIVVNGENLAALNEVTSLTTLLSPTLQETTASATATVYRNAIILDPRVATVATRVVMDGTWELLPARRKERDREWANWFWLNHDYGFWGAYGFTDNRVGCPRIYWVESMINQTTGIRQQKLCVYPMPSGNRLIEFECTYTAPSVTLATLLPADAGSFPPGTGDTSYIPMPIGEHESVLLPYARAELAKLPNFQASKVALVEKGLESARKVLLSHQPQEQGGIALEPLYQNP